MLSIFVGLLFLGNCSATDGTLLFSLSKKVCFTLIEKRFIIPAMDRQGLIIILIKGVICHTFKTTYSMNI